MSTNTEWTDYVTTDTMLDEIEGKQDKNKYGVSVKCVNANSKSKLFYIIHINENMLCICPVWMTYEANWAPPVERAHLLSGRSECAEMQSASLQHRHHEVVITVSSPP